jgi:hypothetical protein
MSEQVLQLIDGMARAQAGADGRRDLERVAALLTSATFLSGLGRDGPKLPRPSGIPLIDDPLAAFAVLVNYPGGADIAGRGRIGHLGEVLARVALELRLNHPRLDREAARARLAPLDLPAIAAAIADLARQRLDALGATEVVAQRCGPGGFRPALLMAPGDDDRELWSDVSVPPGELAALVAQDVGERLASCVKLCVLGAIADSAALARYLQLLETGGWPCGWQGSDAEAEVLSDPATSMLLLHRGGGG